MAADQLEGCAHSSESINNHFFYAARSQLCIRGLMKVHQAPIFSKDCTPLWLSGYGKDRKSEAFFRDDHKILEVDFSDEFI